MARVLFIENHDSFSWNVIDALPFAREDIEIVRADEARLDGVDVVVMGPGPTDPERAGLVELVREVARRRLTFLGVCLGHQALGLAFGAGLRRSTPSHGKQATVEVAPGSRFAELGPRLEVMRYHSLSLIDVRAPLRVTAALADGTVMAIEHESLPMVGVQFHPDSFGTPRGRELLSLSLRQRGETSPAEPPTTRDESSLSLRQRGEGRGEGPNWAQTRGSPPALSGQGRGEGPKSTPAPVRATPLTPLTPGLLPRNDFALLAPGFTDTPHWTLIEDLRPSPTGELWFASAESRAPRRFTGRISALDEPLRSSPEQLTVTLDDARFLEGVTTIRERISAGDVYQVNLTVRAKVEGVVDGGALLAQLCRRAVPRFAAWVKSRHLGEFVSASPELLVETRGRWIHAEPMKGTAAPGDRAFLEASEKDRAELAMITDLLRDDLHRLCEPGSVHVTNERRFIELPYVLQAVADVEGTLCAGLTTADVLRVVHPGGSVTGAPREAALEVISELESSPRGAYCGTLGLEREGLARFALLIRTAERVGDAWRYGVGSGITWDSVPEAELAEVRLKLGALEHRGAQP